MKKRITSIALTLVLLLSLVGACMVTPEGTVTASAATIKYDFNSDGVSNLKDVSILFNVVAGKMKGTYSDLSSFDVTGDGKTNLRDVAALFRRYMDMDATATPNMNADGSMNLDQIAYYDSNYDYSRNAKLGMAYIAASADSLYQQQADAYQLWCSKMNLRWDGFYSASGDSDTFLSLIQTVIDQGTRLLILDPDISTYPAIYNILEPYEGQVYWINDMGQARDYVADSTHPYGNLLAPYVGTDQKERGRQCANWLVDWFKLNYPNVNWNNVGFVSCTFSLSSPLEQRREGVEEVWLNLPGVQEDVNYFVADTLSTSLDSQGGIDALNPIVKAVS